jgi:hypothetical protein
MARNERKNNKKTDKGVRNNALTPPPDQIAGVLIFHPNPEIDQKIRQVYTLVYEQGYIDLELVGEAVGIRLRQVYNYLEQIHQTILLYAQTYPEQFERTPEAIARAIHRRQDLDRLLHEELRAQPEPGQGLRNKVGLFRVILDNVDGLERLSGLHVQHVAHSDAEGNPLPVVGFVAGETLGQMMKRLAAEEQSQGAGTDDQPDPQG